jgi:Tubulin like
MTMKLYQPVLFVGLGGTGCDVGAELERRLRDEICGPDGTEFQPSKSRAGMLPYQLPSCVQFVYADMNQADLDRMPQRVVPGTQHLAAARQTAHYVRDLVPMADSYPELARNLRLEAPRVVGPWLPPEDGEPRVNPLHRGAGQFPTIGRAALFGTFLHGINGAVRDIDEAIGKLATSGEDLHALGGRPPKAVDVFVAFSVAGGTGTGLFYDYLHLIGHMFRKSALRAKIYPLVLMPSAFDRGLGGGRVAELNSGRALLDLFRLVDQQNGGDAERELRGHREHEPIDPEEQAVHYPEEGRIVLRPGTVQTGFLFSRPAGASRSDLHRSIVSLVLSLIGTELDGDKDRPADTHQSFADSFINASIHRQVPAENGIGSRGVSTALVASLTIPVDELAGIVGGRLLRTAIDQLARPVSSTESNLELMEDFLIKAGIHPILGRHGNDFAEPDPVSGARDIAVALNDRLEAMKAALTDLDVRLNREIPQMVAGFEPRRAIREMLARTDVFRVQRVLFGHAELAGEIDQRGVAGLLTRRRAAPQPPAGYGMTPPVLPELRDQLGGVRKLKWADPVPVEARERQHVWYRWRTQVAWAHPWAAHTPHWRRPLEVVESELRDLAKALLDLARQDEERFEGRAAELYRPRVGVSYLLPPGAGRMEQFYKLVVSRLTDYLVQQDRVKPAASDADVVQALVGASGWRETYETGFEQSAEQAVADLREKVKAEIKAFLRMTLPGQRPLLPKLHDLLAAVAGTRTEGNSARENDRSALRDYREEFGGKLAGLVPANFNPQGSGPMKVLISYPADAKSPAIEEHLKQSINRPEGPDIAYECKNTHTESISVVLFRTSMGVTEVGEVRDVLRLWARALARPEPTDLLRWRQRTGYDFGYLATREEHRVQILHRILCALWNGRGKIEGPAASPDVVGIELSGAVSMQLRLTPLEHASSWGSLLRAYELWAFDDDDIHRRFCAQLMRELPRGLEGRIVPPDDLYLVVQDLVKGEIEQLDEMLAYLPPGSRTRAAQLRGFWADTMPAALDWRFSGLEAPTRQTLRDLELAVQGGSGR